MAPFRHLAVTAAMLLAGATAAQADTGVVSFTVSSGYGSYDGTDQTIGFDFSTANAINVSGLGWYAFGGKMVDSHEVGIWDTAGTLLGSVTVAPGTADADGFVFASVPTFTLAAGQYFIGGEVSPPFVDSYTTEVTNLVTGTGITFLDAARSGSRSGFAFPSTTSSGKGRFGPNFEFTAAAVPEPGTWAMMFAGFAVMGAMTRSRRRGIVSVAA